ncbi:MFS transporter [Verminephrobacter eiseniae]|uniref:Major facilitator superfamily MFS_1 n=1 Tax=Verminephrobacter eiseniae (strain EF01-2) TaxID=391735 RepID=A1WKP2_VEREI|nr:MFS transporter [Verminephrobacter eiseniae]ABM58199.1 major facilitator superfamily MFS_1 [Verminephrobacter eiseniae EF01-2]
MNKIEKINPGTSGNALLAVILLAIFVVPSSISGTALALPAIGIDLGASIDNLQWVVNAFNLMFACFTLTWGALADKIGHKRCFLMGSVLYAIASVCSAMASDPLFLDLMRGLAGIGAAAVFSCGISILSIQFEGAARMRAFAFFGTVAGLGVSLGPTLSGILLGFHSWNAIFWFHAISLSIVIFASSLIPADKARAQATKGFDTIGATLFIFLLLALMMAIVQAPVWGWANMKIISLLIASALLLAAFIKYETHRQQPVLDLSLLLNGKFVGMALVTVAVSFGFVTLLTYLPTYLMTVLHLSATQAGLSMILLTSPMLVCPILAGKLATRGVDPVNIIYISLLSLLLGVASLALISHPRIPVLLLSLPLLLVGIGMGLSAGLVDGLALKFVPEEKTGMAAGVVNTFRLGSEAIAVALYGAFLSTVLELGLKDVLHPFAGETGVAKTWIDKLAAGDINFPLQAVASDKADALKIILENGYNGSFHYTLWAISIILVGLMVAIYKLIHSGKD